MKPFEFIKAASTEEAIATLAEHGPGIRSLAGGTDLLVDLKHVSQSPGIVLDVSAIEDLGAITLDDDGLHIGAGATHTAIMTNPLIAPDARILANQPMADLAIPVEIDDLFQLCLVEVVGNLDDGRPEKVPQELMLQPQRVETRRIVVVLLVKAPLAIVDSAQKPPGLLDRRLDKGRCTPPHCPSRKLHKAPLFGKVHIDQALGRPDPVVGALTLHLGIAARIVFDRPLHPREVDPPLVAIGRR